MIKTFGTNDHDKNAGQIMESRAFLNDSRALMERRSGGMVFKPIMVVGNDIFYV